MKLLDELNDMQKKAVLQTQGPILILAGAGSGKTKTLTHRIAYLIKNKKISPYNILAVTFTNKAATQMSDRLQILLRRTKISNASGVEKEKQAVNKEQKLPWLGTFHSICVKILRRDIDKIGYSNDFIIYDQQDSLNLIKRICKEVSMDTKKNNPRAIQSLISGAKSEMVDPLQYRKYADGYFQENVAIIYKKYDASLKKMNALDFDDLLNKTVYLFKNNESVLNKYQQLFKYILVDEYQDTNFPQYIFCKLLASKHRNICVVGDDWQSIYAFRGANFRNILNFEKDWPKTEVIKLEQNYRSTKNILDVADVIIKKNELRSDKTLWTSSSSGDLVTIYEASDQYDEIEFIVNEIQSVKSRRSELTYNDFVILYRTNAQSRSVEEVLINYNIKYRIVGGVQFYARKEIKDVLAYLKIIQNSRDEISMERIINVPRRGIGKKTFEKYKEDLTLLTLTTKNLKVDKFINLIKDFTVKSDTLKPIDLIDYIVQKSGYRDFILDGSTEGEGRWENIEELKSVASKYDKLEDFLSEVSLFTDMDNQDFQSEAITLMTVHNAKGLEYHSVFVVGMEEGLFPHARSLLDPLEMEEERRLAYVAITRACKSLCLSYAKSRLIYGEMKVNMPSRFVSELPEKLIDKV
jgi:DNA helicase-2/ATP-dependent DNA helicase PcrA